MQRMTAQLTVRWLFVLLKSAAGEAGWKWHQGLIVGVLIRPVGTE